MIKKCRNSFHSIILISALFLCGTSRVFALDVAVVYQNNSDANEKALEGYKEYYGTKNTSVNFFRFNLNDVKTGDLRAQILNSKPQIVLALGSGALEYVGSNINDIPVVFLLVFADENKALNPNVSGVSLNISPIQKVEMIQKVLPTISKAGIFYSEESQEQYNALNTALRESGLSVIGKKIASDKDFPAALAELNSKMDFFITIPDSKLYFIQSIKYLLLEGLRNKFVVVGLSSLFTKAGAAMSLECDYKDIGRQAATVSARILSGEPPSSIKVIAPRKVSYSLNIQVLKRLGIEPSSGIIKGASEVFGESN